MPKTEAVCRTRSSSKPSAKSRAACPIAGRVLWADTVTTSAPQKGARPRKVRWAPWAPSTKSFPPWAWTIREMAPTFDNVPAYVGEVIHTVLISGHLSSAFSTSSGEMGPGRSSSLSQGRSSQTGSRSRRARALKAARWQPRSISTRSPGLQHRASPVWIPMVDPPVRN